MALRIDFNKSLVFWVTLSPNRFGKTRQSSLNVTNCKYDIAFHFIFMVCPSINYFHRDYLWAFLRLQHEPEGLGRLADKLVLRHKIAKNRFLVKLSWEVTSWREKIS